MTTETTVTLPKKPEWQASYCGVSIYTDPNLSPNTIELRDDNGDIIARIFGARRVVISEKRS